MAPDYMLCYGDNLDILRRDIKSETVDLCYIDPPFNSKRNYNQIYNNVGAEDRAQAQAFIDTWTWDDRAAEGFEQILANQEARFHPKTVELLKGLYHVLGESSLFAYLVSMTLRIVEIHRVLKPTGSFYVHCDPTVSHYLKLVLDGIFCSQGGDFLTEIVWQRTLSKGLSTRRLPSNHDVVFLYSKGDAWTWNVDTTFRPYDPDALDEKTSGKYCHRDPDGRVYRLSDLTNPNPDRPNLTYKFLGVTKVWRWTRDRMQAAFDAGLVVQTKPGTIPQLKRYLDEQRGRPLDDVWTDIPPLNSQAKERLGYPTQKPLALMERIILASSNEDDVVLDPFCGCGTTIDAAHALKRRWIGMDITYQSISLMLQRLSDRFGSAIADSIIVGGVPKDMESAVALAHKKDDRVRKEFEKWAVLTYTNNRGSINEKKGADSGIDGVAYFLTGPAENATMVFQVKSGGVDRGDVAQFRGDMARTESAMGTLITLEKPTAPMIAEARKAGHYHHALMGRDYPKIQIVTVQEIIEEGKRLDLPLAHDVLKPGSTSLLPFTRKGPPVFEQTHLPSLA